MQKQSKGGGLCIVIHKTLNFVLREDFNKDSKNAESPSVEIINNKSENVIALAIYKPPEGR